MIKVPPLVKLNFNPFALSFMRPFHYHALHFQKRDQPSILINCVGEDGRSRVSDVRGWPGDCECHDPSSTSQSQTTSGPRNIRDLRTITSSNNQPLRTDGRR